MSRLPLLSLLACGLAFPALADTAPPLSPAQVALFATPQLKNITHPETLAYSYVQKGPDGFKDTLTEQIEAVNPDGTKNVSIDFLTGDHHAFVPEVDHFRGNPLIMVFLQRDVDSMKQEIGLAASWFRDGIRAALVNKAQITDGTMEVGGKQVPVQRISLRPFADNERLSQLPFVQQKLYTFVLSNEVPGGVVKLSADQPADAKANVPAIGRTITYTGVKS